MNPDLFIDEKPREEGGGGAWEGGWVWESGMGGGGWGWGSDGNDSETPPRWVYRDLAVKEDITALRISAGGRLMQDDPRGLIHCGQLCVSIPPLIVYIRGQEEAQPENHDRCALVRLKYDSCGRYLYADAPVDAGWARKKDSTGETPAYIGCFPLCEPEERLQVQARWQGGHWKHAQIREMRFFLFGIDLGWMTIPLGNWKTVATITVDNTFHINVNGFPARIGGNREILEKYADH